MDRRRFMEENRFFTRHNDSPMPGMLYSKCFFQDLKKIGALQKPVQLFGAIPSPDRDHIFGIVHA